MHCMICALSSFICWKLTWEHFTFKGRWRGEFDNISCYMACNETSILLIRLIAAVTTLILSGPVESIEVAKLYFFLLKITDSKYKVSIDSKQTRQVWCVFFTFL